jgi:hypothetical protein
MTDLATWLRAQLDEDERIALAASPGPWKPNAEHDEVLAVDDERVADGFALSGNQLRATVDHIVCWDPARVLAEVDAKRRVLDLHAPFTDYAGRIRCEHCTELCHSRSGLGCEDPADAIHPCRTVLLLSLPYGDRPGFDPRWALAAVA